MFNLLILLKPNFENTCTLDSIKIQSNMKDNIFWVCVVYKLNVGIAFVPETAKSIFVTLSKTTQTDMNFVVNWNMSRFILIISR